MSFHRAIMAFVVSGLFISTAVTTVQASTTHPFKTLRVIVQPDGTLFVGGNRVSPGQGFTVTHISTGHYRATFPVGTWNDPGVGSCFFIPQAQTLFTSTAAQITGYVTNGDGSGSIDVVTSSGADAWIVMVFTSAEC